MLDTDRFIDEGLEYIQAFPSTKERRLTDFLWQTVDDYDWGYNLIAHLTGKDTKHNAAWWYVWIGTDVIVLWVLAMMFLAGPVFLRNQLVKPTYEKRIRAAVRRLLK